MSNDSQPGHGPRLTYNYRLSVAISTMIFALLAMLILFGTRTCNSNDVRKQDYMKSCVGAGRHPLECRDASRW